MTGRILLTGATGFVGRQVLRALQEQGRQLTIVVRDAQRAREFCDGKNVQIVICDDIFSVGEAWWSDVLQGINLVIHSAWYVEPGKYLTSNKNFDCLTGTLEMARAAVTAGVRRFVGIGTCFEYQLSDEKLLINTPLNPTTAYSAAKAATYLALSQWLPTQNVEFAWCRLFYLFGEGEDERRLVSYVRKQLANGENVSLTSGNQVRDFMNVREAGEMIRDTALSSITGPVNVCSGVPVTVREFVERIARQYGREHLLSFGKRQQNLLDPPTVVGDRTVLDLFRT